MYSKISQLFAKFTRFNKFFGIFLNSKNRSKSRNSFKIHYLESWPSRSSYQRHHWPCGALFFLCCWYTVENRFLSQIIEIFFEPARASPPCLCSLLVTVQVTSLTLTGQEVRTSGITSSPTPSVVATRFNFTFGLTFEQICNKKYSRVSQKRKNFYKYTKKTP